MKSKILGNCQCCGRQQAVLSSGFMSKHGYKVENGWFNGVCQGHNAAPMQKDRSVTDSIVAQIRAELVELKSTIENLKSGKIHPFTVSITCSVTVPFNEAPEYAQKNAIDSAIYKNMSRIRAGAAVADQLESLATKLYGTALIESAPVEGPAPINIGDKKLSKRGELTVSRIEAQRVYWKDQRGFTSYTGSRAWRALPDV